MMRQTRNRILDRYPILLGYIAAVVTILLIFQIIERLR